MPLEAAANPATGAVRRASLASFYSEEQGDKGAPTAFPSLQGATRRSNPACSDDAGLPEHNDGSRGLHYRPGTDSDFRMTPSRIVVFDLDGTLVDTAPDLINALNYVLDREGLPPVPLHAARNMIGQGARKLIERGLELEGRAASVEDINRLTRDFIEYYAAHIADASRPFEGLESALDELSERGFRFAVCTNKLEWLSKLLLDQLGFELAI